MTPPWRSSLSLKGSVELPLVAGSSGTVCGEDLPALWSLFGEVGVTATAALTTDPASSPASAVKRTERRRLGIGVGLLSAKQGPSSVRSCQGRLAELRRVARQWPTQREATG